MKSYKRIKRKLIKLQKTTSRAEVFFSGPFFKLLFCLIILIGYLAIAEYAMPNFENAIKGNENWAIALVALPTALLGIYISILLPLLKEMNTKVLGITLREIHKSIPRIADYRKDSWLFIFINTSLWIYHFILQDYKNMIATAIYLSLCFIYLIVYAIWLYSLDPVYYYYESKVRFKIKNTDYICVFENATLTAIPNLNEDQIAKIDNYISKTYSNEFETIDMLFLEALCQDNTEQAKSVLQFIINESKSFSELNIIIANRITHRTLDLCDELLKRNEFLFLSSLTSSALSTLNTHFTCAMENLTNYISIIKKHTSLIAKHILEFTKDCKPLLLKHLFYYNMLFRSNNQLANILTKLQSIEGLSMLSIIKPKDLKEIDEFFKQYDEIISTFIKNFQVIDNSPSE